MIDPILDSAYEYADRMGDKEDREEWAYEQITEALYGDEKQSKAMLKELGVDEEEYREEYLCNPDALAEAYIGKYLGIIDAEAAEYNAGMMVDR
jgi:phage FluMu gp28-like protein